MMFMTTDGPRLSFSSASVEVRFGNGYSVRTCAHCQRDPVPHEPLTSSHFNIKITHELSFRGQHMPDQVRKDESKGRIDHLPFDSARIQIVLEDNVTISDREFASASSRSKW